MFKVALFTLRPFSLLGICLLPNKEAGFRSSCGVAAAAPDRLKTGLLCRLAGLTTVTLALALGPGIAAAQGEVDDLKRELKTLQERIDRLERSKATAPVAAPEQAAKAKQQGDGGFESKDQSGNDPRDFTTKFMPYYRYTNLKNDLEVHELVAFGFLAFNTRFGMTYEIPLAKHVDYSRVDAFKSATAGGCPPGAGSGSLPPIGVGPGGGGGIPFDDLDCDGNSTGLGDTIIRFFTRPKALEFTFGANKKNLTFIPTFEFTAPTATEDILGGEALILSPGLTFVFDAPVNKVPFSLGFFALMNFYDFDVFRDSDRDYTSRWRGRYFWLQPLSKPTPEFKILDLSGFYSMLELQPVYDFRQNHFSFWIGPEIGKILKPGRVIYFKPGFGVSGDPNKGDRRWTIETGWRYFF